MPKLILNGIEYANNKPDGYPPIIYSEEEREVGVWRDGKPLYQKTIDFGALPNATAKQVNHNISNIDKIITFDITAYNSSSNIFIKIPHVTTSSSSSATANQLQSAVTKTYISVGSGIDYSTYTQSWATLQYTKTTDTPGSGKWSTQGTPTQNYSATEHVIGTWIDGKPLYEKTINLAESNFTKNNNWHWTYNYENDITNYKEVIKMDGIMRIAWNTYKHIIMLGGDCFADNNSSNYLTFCNYYRLVALKGYPYNTSATSLANVVISFCQLTIRYTKTTD